MYSQRLQRRLDDLRDEYDAKMNAVDAERRAATKPLWDRWNAERNEANERYLAELRAISARHDQEVEPINAPFVERFAALRAECDARIAEARAEERAVQATT